MAADRQMNHQKQAAKLLKAEKVRETAQANPLKAAEHKKKHA